MWRLHAIDRLQLQSNGPEDDGSCEWCSCIDADTPDDGFSLCGGAGIEVDYWIESEAVVFHTSGNLKA